MRAGSGRLLVFIVAYGRVIVLLVHEKTLSRLPRIYAFVRSTREPPNLGRGYYRGLRSKDRSHNSPEAPSSKGTLGHGCDFIGCHTMGSKRSRVEPSRKVLLESWWWTIRADDLRGEPLSTERRRFCWSPCCGNGQDRRFRIRYHHRNGHYC